MTALHPFINLHLEYTMKKPIALISLILLSAPALAGDMKAGLWEYKTLKQVYDGKDLSAQMAAAQDSARRAMASLPPEQRKMMEEKMGRQGVAAGGAGAMQLCISEEAAKRKTPMLDRDGRCQPSKMSQSGNTTHFEFDCAIEGRRMAGKGDTTAANNAINTRMDMTTTDGSGTHTMQQETQMTWLGADCKGLAPAGSAKK